MYPPHGDPERIFLDRTYEDFGSDKLLVIAITSNDLFSYPTLKKIDKLTNDIEKIHTVDWVLSITNAMLIKSGKDEITLKNISGKIPQTEWEINKFKDEIISNPIYFNNLISKDLKTTIISVAYDINYPNEETDLAVEKTKKLAMEAAGPDEINISGVAAIAPAMMEMLISDLKTYMPMTALIIAVILFINFRSIKFVLLSLSAISMAILITYSIMSLTRVPIFLLTAALPPIIAAQGITYFIHFFSEYSRQVRIEKDSKRIIKQTLRYVMLSIWLSMLTTVIGFISISPVNITTIREMGIFLSIGILALFVLLIFFVAPILMWYHPPVRSLKKLDHISSKNTQIRFPMFFIKYRLVVFIGMIILCAFSIIGIRKIVVETDLNRFFKTSHPLRISTDAIAERMHGIAPVSIVVEGEREGDIEDPKLLHYIDTLENILSKWSHVSKAVSITDYIKMINMAFHEGNRAYYALPKTKEEVSQYLLMYSLADPRRTINRYIDYDHRISNITLRISNTKTSEILNLKQSIEEQCKKIFPPNIKYKVTGDTILLAQTSYNLTRGILIGFTQAGLAIFIVMMILFRSVKMGIVAMIPNIIPMLFVLAVMGFLGIDFNVGTSIVVCISLGIAVDDTIHFLVRYFYELKQTNHYLIRATTGIKITDDQKKAILKTYGTQFHPITMTAVSVILGFCILSFSQFLPVMAFGLLTAIAMIFGIICELIILPSLLASISI